MTRGQKANLKSGIKYTVVIVASIALTLVVTIF